MKISEKVRVGSVLDDNILYAVNNRLKERRIAKNSEGIKYVEKIKINGVLDDYVSFVLEHQLKNREIWHKICEVFSTREDIADEGWRGEYFGKLMRGAVYVYRYTDDKELYDILTAAAEDLLSRQDEYGRFSTYTVEKEFCGWDIWARKYVLTGLLHYRSICSDECLKEKILLALEKHLDYIVEKIGGGEGQVQITDTSSWWGGVNSCSILEPVVEMYKLTRKESYLDFAEYIISTGGCKDGNLIELAISEKALPYKYPSVKAYETMSFFEGVLAYYEVTGAEKYYIAVCNFVEAVNESDITLIGCAGCTHELFDNAALKQTEYSETIMQETCVTVTWMRLLSRLYFLSGNVKYIDRIECSGFNALYGSLNTQWNEQYSFERKKYVSAMPFDSYSPLYMNKRGRGIGGYKEFQSGGYFGCCIAIAACGIALLPLTAVMESNNGFIINILCNATVQGKNCTLNIKSDYPHDGHSIIKIECSEPIYLNLRIRCPSWCKSVRVKANGKLKLTQGYYTVSGTFNDGDIVEVKWREDVQAVHLNGKIAFIYGPLVLAADALKSHKDISVPVLMPEGGTVYRLLPCEKGELARIQIKTADDEILLTDYQSCGKRWLEKNAIMSVWLNEE